MVDEEKPAVQIVTIFEVEATDKTLWQLGGWPTKAGFSFVSRKKLVDTTEWLVCSTEEAQMLEKDFFVRSARAAYGRVLSNEISYFGG